MVGKHLVPKPHPPAQVVKLQVLAAGRKVVAAPPFTEPVGAGNQQPVDHGHEKRPLQVEFELAPGHPGLEAIGSAALPLQALKDQLRSHGFGLNGHIAYSVVLN